MLNDFKDTFARENDIEVVITGLRESYDPNSQINVVKEESEVRQDLDSPQDILNYLVEGNKRYVDGNLVSRRLRNKELMDFIKEAPLAAVVNSIDMREPLNMLLNTGIGDLIPLRSAGNLMNDHLIQSTEIACRKQGATLILLMGNSGNSFLEEALACHLEGKDSYLSHLLAPALTSGELSLEKTKNNTLDELVDEVTLWNLEESKKRIVDRNPYIREQVIQGTLGLSSAFFDRKTGKIKFSPLFQPSLEASID